MDIIEFNQQIWELVRSIMYGIESIVRVIVDGFGITMAQMRVLAELKHRQECTIGELADATGSAPGNASAMCKTLESKGLVTRTRNTEDERIVIVALTDAGKNLLQEIEHELSSKCDPLLAEFSDDDFAEIVTGMTKLNDVVSRMQNAFNASLRR
jgi:DNA-binding MarR family transcriptional regulator